MGIWVKVFKNEPSKICGKQPLKNVKWYGLPKHLECTEHALFKKTGKTWKKCEFSQMNNLKGAFPIFSADSLQ